MSKTQTDRRSDARSERPPAPVLSASVRRHLGKSLRTFYAATLAEPMSERLEALLSRLDRPRRF